MDDLERYLQEVMDDINATWPKYDELRPEVNTYPIPFFGDIKRARVLTVGVNPSAKEFLLKRDWPERMAPPELKDRLQRYFEPSSAPSHKWFETWVLALRPLGVSYQDGVAHIDLSPRATISMGSAVRKGNSELFAEMVKQDVKWFFKLLSECIEVRLLLFAGCIPGSYISEFMERLAPNHGFDFVGSRTQEGPGKTGFYNIRSSAFERPAFFCSVSPSGRNKEVLIERIEEHKTRLLELLAKQPTHLGV